MQCLACGTQLLHPANFCPVCGARLAAPPPDGSAATRVGDDRPVVTHLPAEPPAEANVVYLPGAEEGRQVPPNPHAGEYRRANDPDPEPAAAEAPAPAATPALAPVPLPVPAPMAVAPEADAAAQVEVPLPQRDAGNPFGDFFSDGPSAWLEDDDEDEFDGQPRIVGTMLAAGAIVMLLAAWGVWTWAMLRGAGGAEAGGFVLLSMLMWIWYLSLPREQQHRTMLRAHERISGLVDRRLAPLRERTEGQLALRRERDRYRAMRDERTRRAAALGEAAYRSFRRGQLPPELHAAAQRVLAMEQQMLLQDHRIEQLARPRTEPAVASPEAGSDAAAAAEDGGHDTAP